MDERQAWYQGWPVFVEKGVGPGRGWWGPPKGTHGPGSLGGTERLKGLSGAELKQELTKVRQKVLSAVHSVEDVISGKHKVGVEGRGGEEIKIARQQGLYTTTVAKVPIYAQSEIDSRPLVNYLERGGKYGTPEFSHLLGYTSEEIADYKRFLDIQDELERRDIA